MHCVLVRIYFGSGLLLQIIQIVIYPEAGYVSSSYKAIKVNSHVCLLSLHGRSLILTSTLSLTLCTTMADVSFVHGFPSTPTVITARMIPNPYMHLVDDVFV